MCTEMTFQIRANVDSPRPPPSAQFLASLNRKRMTNGESNDTAATAAACIIADVWYVQLAAVAVSMRPAAERPTHAGVIMRPH